MSPIVQFLKVFASMLRSGKMSYSDALTRFRAQYARPAEGMEKAAIMKEVEKAPSNIIQFPKDRITDWWKPRPTGPTEEVVTASPDRIRKGFSTVMKLNSPDENQRLLKSFIRRENAEFNSLNREQQKEIFDMFDTWAKKPDMASGGIAGPLHLYDGGRANYDKGGMSRRGFLKMIGGLSALPFVGKYFKAAKTAAPAVEKITTVAGGIPEYASRLIEVVKNKGIMEIMEGIYKRNPPQKKYTYKGVEVTEDGLGNVAVRKEQTKTGSWTDQATDDVIVDDYVDREIGFEIRKGETVTNKKGKQIQTPDEYNESTAYMQGDPDGGMDVSEIIEKIDDVDHLDLKKIADESLIKKAEGGRVDLSKGGLAKILGV